MKSVSDEEKNSSHSETFSGFSVKHYLSGFSRAPAGCVIDSVALPGLGGSVRCAPLRLGCWLAFPGALALPAC